MPDKSRNILIVDDDPSILHILRFNILKHGYRVYEADDGLKAFETAKNNPVDLVITDIMMPVMDGIELLRKLRENTDTLDIPVIMLTAKGNEKERVEGLLLGADDYMSKPFNIEELLLRAEKLLSYKERLTGAEIRFAETKKLLELSKENLADAYKKLEGLMLESLESLITALEARDHYTRGHSERVAGYTGRIALAMALPDVNSTIIAARFHDIGKIGISDVILNKGDLLTGEEMNIIKSHPVKGAEILKKISILSGIIPAVKHHHECFDGNGYPDGLSGRDIPLAARIIAVADTFDAIKSTRPYRSAMHDNYALREIKRFSGIQFDPDIVDVFLDAFSDGKDGGENWTE